MSSLAFLLIAPVVAEVSPEGPPAVGVVAAEYKSITESDEFNGRIQARQRVDLVPRVTAFLDEQLFTEGAEVKTGDLLYRLERGPFEADVEAKQAAIAQAEAQLENANIAFARAEDLFLKEAGTQATLDDARATLRTAAAQLKSAHAQLRQSQINLDYTEIQNGNDLCGWMGVEVRPMTAAFAASLGMAVPYGAIFDQPEPGSPAANAHIEQGDVLTAINGSPLMRSSDFAGIISTMAPGTTVYLATWRNREASLTLGPALRRTSG